MWKRQKRSFTFEQVNLYKDMRSKNFMSTFVYMVRHGEAPKEGKEEMRRFIECIKKK